MLRPVQPVLRSSVVRAALTAPAWPRLRRAFRPLAAPLLALAPAACTDDTPPADTAGADPADEPSAIEEEPVCASPDVTVTDAGTAWTVSTEHYRLSIAGFDEDEARNLGTLAELAWSGLSAAFGGDVAGPLEVFVAADQAGFEAQLAADGISGLEGAGGYYDPNSRRAYLFRQPTAYYSRVLLLHEIVHQYQDGREGIGGLPGWYVEGLAEAFSRHHWDGECLQLRVRPLLSWEDAAAAALAELDTTPPDLAAVLAGGAVSRPVAQELVRLLAGDPELAPRFTTWRDQVATDTISATDVAAFEAAVAPVADVSTALRDFVPADQEPLSPMYLDWIPQGVDRAWGASEASAAARVKGEVDRYTMAIAWPESGNVGALYGYDPTTGDLELALLAPDGGVSRFAVIGGAVTWDGYGAVTPLDAPTWTQTAAADTTTVTLGDASVDLPRALPPAGGPALYGASATFTALTWE